MIPYKDFVGNKDNLKVDEAKKLLDEFFNKNIHDIDDIDNSFKISSVAHSIFKKYEKELHKYARSFGWDFELDISKTTITDYCGSYSQTSFTMLFRKAK